MTKPVRLLYTFIDEQTGNLADILAPNESTARLWLGGRWMIIDRCSVFGMPAPAGNWDKVISEAQQEAADAFKAMNAAGPSTTTTPAALAAFNDASAAYERKKARITKLIEMSVSAA